MIYFLYKLNQAVVPIVAMGGLGDHYESFLAHVDLYNYRSFF